MRVHLLFAAVTAMLLASCGGGGGGALSSTPASVNKDFALPSVINAVPPQ